jgi:hypothetical protein
MSIKPILRDDNGLPLIDRGTELYTKRYTSVGVSGVSIQPPLDVKSVLIHVEGGLEKARITGQAVGSEEARLTADGVSLGEVDVVIEAGKALATIKAPSGVIDVSVFAWR